MQHLLRDGRYGRARVTELGRLLARYEAQPGRLLADRGARAVAERIGHLKRKLAGAIGEVRACSGCAKGCATPNGFFDGGRCCGTPTLDVFTQPEVRAIKLAGGTIPARPAEDGHDDAGCLFRGRTGCALPAELRPSKCLIYLCHELRHELEEDPERFERIQRVRAELDDTFARFVDLTR
ncbi:MAG: hypothetical protein IT378_16565 [Sandaracinaceae bacterium]|nr:hypothetical protein [Sandaracinaceae bacterium]